MDIRSQILQAEDLPSEPVEIPEWGVSVFVRSMSGRDRDLFESQMMGLFSVVLMKMASGYSRTVTLPSLERSQVRRWTGCLKWLPVLTR